MIFHCETPCITCAPGVGGGIGPVDPTNPFLNLSSEAPDVDNFIGRGYTPGQPPLGQFFFAVGCVGFCLNDVSQAEADLCAARQNALCTSVNWPITVINPEFPGPGQPPTLHSSRTLFANTAQTCPFTCGDGTMNFKTVAAGTIFGFSQAQADAQANSLACDLAALDAICMSNLIADRICYGQFTEVPVSASSIRALFFEVIAGAIPDGMTFSQDIDSFTLTGTPTVGGDFNFTVKATDTDGNEATKSYTLQVFGITNSTALTAAAVGTPYLLQLNLDGTPDGVFEYTVTGGALPDGLTLNATSGIIAGTPTTSGDYSFTVKVADSSIECLRDFTLTAVGAFPKFIFTDLFANNTALSAATIGGYDKLLGLPINGTDLGPSVVTAWTVTGAATAYTISYQCDSPATAADAGTWRVTIDNLNIVAATLSFPLGVYIYKNFVQVYFYEVDSTTGPLFVDVILVNGDTLSYILAVDGNAALAGSHQITVSATKLP